MYRRSEIALLLSLQACSAPEHVAIAEWQVPRFHELLNAGEPEKIWYQATTEFQTKYPKEAFVALLHNVRSRLGQVKSTERNRWQATYTGGKVLVTLTQQTQYANGGAIDSFTYRIDGKSAFLTVYFIQSPALKSNEA